MHVALAALCYMKELNPQELNLQELNPQELNPQDIGLHRELACKAVKIGTERRNGTSVS